MRNEIEFNFDDLSLVTQDGVCLDITAQGEATVRFTEDGEWEVRGICLNGTHIDRASGVIIQRFVDFDRAEHPVIYNMMVEALEKQYGAAISDRVSNELEYAL